MAELPEDECAERGGWTLEQGGSPIPGFTPQFSTLDRAHREATLRYGRLRHVSPYGPTAEVDLEQTLRTYGTVLTHGAGMVARHWESVHLTQAEMVGVAQAGQRANVLIGDRHHLITHPYCQYQGNFTKGDVHDLPGGVRLTGRSFYERWREHLATWQALIPEAAWDDMERLFARTAETYARDGVDGVSAHELCTRLRTIQFCFELDAPYTLLRAKAAIAMQLAAGSPGCYFDCGIYGHSDTGYSPYALRNYGRWITEHLPGDVDLADAAVPPLMPRAHRLEPFMNTPDDLDRELFAPASEARLDPKSIAFIRRRHARVAWFLRQLRDYGERLHPAYSSSSTYYVDEAGPHFFVYYNGYDADSMVQRGRANSFLLWESWVNMPHKGLGRGTPRDPALWFSTCRATKADPYLTPSVYGRRSNSAMLRYLEASLAPATGTAKYWPLPPWTTLGGESANGRNFRVTDLGTGNLPILEHLLRLSIAECWSNRFGYRAQQWGADPQWEFVPRAARQMNGFQAHHEDLFLGAARMTRVGVLCSTQQAHLRRYDNSLAVSRLLTDGGIEHRLLIDRHVDEADFGDLCCLVLANVRGLTDRQLATLNAFARRDGCGLVLIGRVGDRDEWDRDRPDARARLGAGVAPGRIVDLGLDVYPRLPHTGGFRIAGLGDDPGPLSEAVTRVHGADHAVLAPVFEFAEVHPLLIPRVEGGDHAGHPRVVVHVVNYDVDLSTCTVTPLPAFEVKVRLPEGTTLHSASVFEPMRGAFTAPGAPLAVSSIAVHGAHYACFTVPETEGHTMVAVELRGAI